MLRKNISPIAECAQMLEDVDSMLNLVRSRSSTQRCKLSHQETPQEFKTAIKILSYRVLNNKPANVTYDSSRLKFSTPTGLGPGSYFRSEIRDQLQYYPHLTVKDFENTPRRLSKTRIISPISVGPKRKSPKDHNTKVDQLVRRRVELHNMNNVRKRDRFKTKMNTVHEESRGLYCKELIELFIPLCLVQRISASIVLRVKETKVGRM